jgi:hypothetical protein
MGEEKKRRGGKNAWKLLYNIGLHAPGSEAVSPAAGGKIGRAVEAIREAPGRWSVAMNN